MSTCFFDLGRTLTLFLFFFFNDTATTEIYTLSLHDALPIWDFHPITAYLFVEYKCNLDCWYCWSFNNQVKGMTEEDRKSTRLNSSHQIISYAVFCLKKKNTPAKIKARAKAVNKGT